MLLPQTRINRDIGSLIVFAILNCGGGGGEGSEAGGNVGGCGGCRMRYIIKLIALLRETLANSSSLSREGEIKGLFSNSSLLL